MKLRVLGSSGAEFPKFRPPAFLIDGEILLDAGTIGGVLNEKEQWKLKYILLTHAHLDHIKGIPFLADNIIIRNQKHNVTIMSIESVLDTLKGNLLNDKVWPDFTAIPNRENPVLTLKTINERETFDLNGYKITPRRVDHAVPATGYIVEDKKGRRLLYTGDTGPTTEIWEETANRIHSAIIEVSMPNNMREMAIMTGHLTAELLKEEINKMKLVPDLILITHPKPQYLKIIKSEIKALGMKNIKMLHDGDEREV